jgi:hypothetical protein
VTAECFERVSAWGQRQWAAYAGSIPGRNGEEEQAVWQATRPLILGEGRLFAQEPAALARLQAILLEGGLLDCPVQLEAMFPDCGLPAEGAE